eukprot:9476953-Pyramimonas_sp.AAC.2
MDTDEARHARLQQDEDGRLHPWIRMKRGMLDYNEMKMGDSNRACDWLRARVLANVEMRRSEGNRRNLKNETTRHALAACAACKAGRCECGE